MLPFVREEAEEFAASLCAHLNARRGVKAELLRIPFSLKPSDRLADEIFLNRTLQLPKLPKVDRVIGLRFPAYLISHPAKVLWLLHPSWPTYTLPSRDAPTVPELIRRANGQAFSTCRRIFADCVGTSEGLKREYGVSADVLMPPLKNPELFEDWGDDGYIFAGGTVSPTLRQHLLVEAMGLAGSSTKLIVAGPLDAPDYGHQLQITVKRLNLEGRVVLDYGHHDPAKIAWYVNRAKACVYLPLSENSLGCVTMQAALASKPVITSVDAGGVGRLVVEGETGCVTQPVAKSLAEAIDLLAGDAAHCRRLGRAARQLLDSFEVTWPNTIEKLLA
jgi:glycosyltransferase involved in cell wall biosynthesis